MSAANKGSKKNDKRTRATPEGTIFPGNCYCKDEALALLGGGETAWKKLLRKLRAWSFVPGWWNGTYWIIGEWLIRAIMEERRYGDPEDGPDPDVDGRTLGGPQRPPRNPPRGRARRELGK